MQRLTTHGLMLSLLVFVSLYTQATPQSSAQTHTEFQYAAKFVCGKSDGAFAARGQYFTIINVHNPFAKQVRFRKKFALGEPGERVGKIFGFFPAPQGQEGLGPDKVMGIDCPDIYKHSGISEGTFIEGYAVLHSPAELDVVSVFTAGDDHVATLHTERVPFRKVPFVPQVCSDLKLNLSTGLAPWQITSDPLSSTTEPRAASVLPVAPNFPPLAGSQWVGPFSNSGLVGVSRGNYVYEFSFCLCQGFSNAKLALIGLSDDSARVFLNGTALAPTIPGLTPATAINANAPFIVGTNTVRVIVLNKEQGLTGLNLGGSITATAGACPN